MEKEALKKLPNMPVTYLLGLMPRSRTSRKFQPWIKYLECWECRGILLLLIFLFSRLRWTFFGWAYLMWAEQQYDNKRWRKWKILMFVMHGIPPRSTRIDHRTILSQCHHLLPSNFISIEINSIVRLNTSLLMSLAQFYKFIKFLPKKFY